MHEISYPAASRSVFLAWFLACMYKVFPLTFEKALASTCPMLAGQTTFNRAKNHAEAGCKESQVYSLHAIRAICS